MKVTRTLVRACIGIAALALSGCATIYDPVPAGYTGSTAHIADSIQPRSASVANVFAVVEIDGKSIADTFRRSAQVSQGQGFRLTTLTADRYVPARPLKLKLMAHPMTGAPIQAMAMQVAGTYFTVDGIVEFQPQPGGRYVVRGELKKEGSSVWLEDAASGQIVTEKVSQRP